MTFPLLRLTNHGLYCERGGFHIDPWSPVARAVITHAHGDHAVKGSRQYLCAEPGRRILKHRMQEKAQIDGLAFGEPFERNGVRMTFHPAGHILGSAQVRVEDRGEVWVVSGDYKVAPDVTCTPFEPVPCDTFITESTFGHPYFHWEPQQETFARIHRWWLEQQQRGNACLLYAYSLGKAQRLLAGLDGSLGPIFAHPSVEQMNALYRRSGIDLPPTRSVLTDLNQEDWSNALILLPPANRWGLDFPVLGHYSTAFVSGWMQLPGGPASRGVAQGFALSDHADHNELLEAISATKAQRVLVTHGYIDELVTDLNERGLDAKPHRTPRCSPPPRVPETIQRELAFG